MCVYMYLYNMGCTCSVYCCVYVEDFIFSTWKCCQLLVSYDMPSQLCTGPVLSPDLVGPITCFGPGVSMVTVIVAVLCEWLQYICILGYTCICRTICSYI